MFGYKTVRISDMNALEAKISSLQAEVKSAEAAAAAAAAAAGMQVITLGETSALQSAIESVSRQSIKRCYESCGAAYGIINKIAGAVGEVARYLELRSLKDGRYDEKHWLVQVLKQPNRRENLKRFATGWAVNRLSYGDAWIYGPNTVGKDYGQAKALVCVPSWKVDPGRKESLTDLFETMKSIRITGMNGTFSPDDFIESFNYNLDDSSYYGTSPLVVAAVYLTIIDNAMQRQDTSLKNGGPSAIVSPKPDAMGVMPQTADRLTEDLNGKDVKGQIKAVRTALDVHQLGVSPVDLGILDAHDKAINVLCFIYGLPVDLYLGQAKYENAKEAAKSLYEQNAIPLAEELGADLLAHYGLSDQYEFVVNRDKVDVLQMDPKDMLENLEKMHATLNEMREAYGYDPRTEPWADLPLMQMGTMFGAETVDIDELAE